MAIGGVLAAGSGCDLLGPATVKVKLVNKSPFAVDPQFYRSGSLSDEKPLFAEMNLYTEFAQGVVPVVPAGKTVEFKMECEAAARLGISSPIFTVGDERPGGQTVPITILLHGAGQDFSCGDTITFEFLPGAKQPAVKHEVTSP